LVDLWERPWNPGYPLFAINNGLFFAFAAAACCHPLLDQQKERATGISAARRSVLCVSPAWFVCLAGEQAVRPKFQATGLDVPATGRRKKSSCHNMGKIRRSVPGVVDRSCHWMPRHFPHSPKPPGECGLDSALFCLAGKAGHLQQAAKLAIKKAKSSLTHRGRTYVTGDRLERGGGVVK